MKGRGFASMDKERHRKIAQRGGLQSSKSGKAHRWTKEEAQFFGKKGGRPRRLDIQDNL